MSRDDKPHIYRKFGAWWCHMRPYRNVDFMGLGYEGPVSAYKDWEWKCAFSNTSQTD